MSIRLENNDLLSKPYGGPVNASPDTTDPKFADYAHPEALVSTAWAVSYTHLTLPTKA